MRLLFLNRSYFPDVEATGQLLTELCEDLASRFEIHVLSGQPNWIAEKAEFRQRGADHRAGVTIRRVRHTRFPKSSYFGRIANQITFFLSATLQALWLPRPDAVIVMTDPPFLGILGRILSWRYRCRLVAYLQDVYPDIAVSLGKLPAGFPTNIIRFFLHGVYRAADRVIVLSDDMRDKLVEYGVESARISVAHNWSDTDLIAPVDREANRFLMAQGLSDRFVVMYSGNMGLSQRLGEILEAAHQLRDRSEVEFVLIGNGASRKQLEDQVRTRQLSNVRILDYQAKSELSHSLSAADLQLIPFDERVVPYLMPSKLYGILAAGRPVLAITPADCHLARIVESNQVGFVTPPCDPTSLATIIRRCLDRRDELDRLGKNARMLAVRDHDRRNATRQIGDLFEEWRPEAGGRFQADFPRTRSAPGTLSRP